MQFIRITASVLLAMSLCACGGGGSGSDPSPPANSAPSANACAAQSLLAGASVTLDGSASSDPEGTALSYSWVLTSKPAASSAALAGTATAKPSLTADVAGSYVLTLTVSDGRLTSAPGTVTVTAVSTETLAIRIDKTDPLIGVAQLSLSDSTFGAPVTWYVDQTQVGTGTSLALDTTRYSNTPHQLLARIQVAAGKTIDIQRRVNVANSGITLGNTLKKILFGTAITMLVDVSANSPAGIVSVSATVDGLSLGSLTAPNNCAGGCANGLDLYNFEIDGPRVGSGIHTLLVTAVDGRGVKQQLETLVPIYNAPVVSLTGMHATTFVYGKLNYAGTYTSDNPGPFTVTAYLGDDLEILKTTARNFTASYDLAGLTQSGYTLRLEAIDSAGQVGRTARMIIIASAPDLVYAPVMSYGAWGMLAVEGKQVLYAAGHYDLRVRDVGSGAERALPIAAAESGNNWQDGDWQIIDGHVFGRTKGGDCPTSDKVCLYMWRPDGSRVNLTAGTPRAGTVYDGVPVVRAGFVAWKNIGPDLAGSYMLYEIASGKYTRIAPAAEVPTGIEASYDLAVQQGVVHLVYSGSTGVIGAPSSDVFRWSLSTGLSTRLSTPGGQQTSPRIDGDRIVWAYQGPASSPADRYGFISLPLAGGSPVRLVSTSTPISAWRLRDGVLTWTENLDGRHTLKAMAGTGSVATLTSGFTPPLLGTSGGIVAYTDGSKIRSWDASTGLTKLRVDIGHATTLVTGSTMYFQIGNDRMIFSAPLK